MIKPLIIHNPGFVGGIFTFDADALAFLNAAGITDWTQKVAINTLVKDLKAASIWTKMLAIYPFVGGSATTHKWNLKDPRDLDVAFRLSFVNTPTHSATGVDWNGTTQYASTFLAPGTYQGQNDAHISYYSRENVVDGNKNLMGSQRSSVFSLLIPKTTSLFSFGVQTTASSTTANTDSRGFFLASRIGGTTQEGYRNGSLLLSGSVASISSGNTSFYYIGCRNNTGTAQFFSDAECAFASIGLGLTSSEVSAFYTAVQNYQTTLSRQV